MGMFGSRKKTFVSSVVYNLAGDENLRPDYLKTTIIGGVMNQSDSLGQTINDSYMNGPGLKLRNFARWSRSSGYTDAVGLVTGSLSVGGNINTEVLVQQIPHDPDQTVLAQTADIGPAEYTYWADRWMADNHPDQLNGEWRSDMVDQTMTIYFDDVATYSFTVTDFDPNARYIYASYSVGLPPSEGPVVTGEVIPLAPTDSWPSTTGWDFVSTSPTETIYTRTRYVGSDPDQDATYSLKETMYQMTAVDTSRSYRIDSQKLYGVSWSNIKVFIYKYGSGNPVLDEMFANTISDQQFFPFIPFRIDNEFVSETNMPEIYEQSKKAMRKATNGKYDDIVENIADNESLDDIDYAYAVFGVSLNVKEVACREYIYRFFKNILEQAGTEGSGEYNAWRIQWNAADVSVKQWATWRAAQSNPTDPLFGTPEPVKLTYPVMPLRQIRISSDNNEVMNYDMTIEWNSIQEEVLPGVGKEGAKRGDLWFQVGTTEFFEQYGSVNGVWESLFIKDVNNIDLFWQDQNNSYRVLKIKGLAHTNLIYNNKSVIIEATEALEDTEESGFIIPLHEGIYRQMSIKKATQMSTACAFLVFNCYQVVKKKWYQTGLFQVILIIVIIVITIFTAGAGAGAGAGLLGTNAAVGAAIGLTGMTAIIVGAIANAIAAMLLVTIIQRGAVALFGDKLGTIIGAIAAVIALQVGTAMANGQTFSASFANMGRADNLLRLTQAGADGYAGYLNASTQDTLQEIEKTLNAYKVESEKISEAYAKEFGLGRAVIDPIMITEAARQSFVPEARQDFLSRTLLLGSDICDMSLEMIGRFADLTLSTKLST